MEKIELLDVSLLEDDRKLAEIDHWLNVLNWTNGWHYDLDIVWLLRLIEEIKLPKGATVLDAGAGLGVMQFILAARGYNVISLDFGRRQIPGYSKGIFDIRLVDRDLGDYSHEYIDFMTYGQKAGIKNMLSGFWGLWVLFSDPARAVYSVKSHIRKLNNPVYAEELKRDHSGFGKIQFLRGTFNDIPLRNSSVDLLVSISAFEHNKFDDMAGSIQEFNRVLRPGAHMMITTSASKEKDWYHKPSKGWNFSRRTLSEWFGIVTDISFDYEDVLEKIMASDKLKRRIPEYYRHSRDSGLPSADLSRLSYIPVGVISRKRQKTS